MKQNVWIWNHYATNMFFDKAGRHYWFAENLIESGYKPTIFCASTNHFSNSHVSVINGDFSEKKVNDIPFVFVRTNEYNGNGKKRLLNMFSFYQNLFGVSKEYIEKNGKPDVIIASSVHPLTLIAGIKIAKQIGIPCICEVRDLWPESLIAYGTLKRNSIIAKILYQGEKWIYKKANAVIITWEGGKQYITDQGWDSEIDLNKIKHISNGVIMNTFDVNSQKYEINDDDLNDCTYKNIVYTGSIRKVNNLGSLLDAAKIINEKDNKIRFLIYGSGNEKSNLEQRCLDEGITNVIFKGRVEKKMVPSILKKSYANVLHNSSTSLDKYGQSQNKFFEYLAAGKCIIQTYTTGYSILEKYNCGVSASEQTPERIAEIVLEICSNEEKAKQMGIHARQAAYEFDFKKLTSNLVDIINNV